MPKLFRLAQVMEILNLSHTQAYREMKAGRLAWIQRGTHRLFEEEAIAAYVSSLKVTDGVDRLLELVDGDGRLDVASIPTGTTLADLEAVKAAVAERQEVA